MRGWWNYALTKSDALGILRGHVGEMEGDRAMGRG